LCVSNESSSAPSRIGAPWPAAIDDGWAAPYEAHGSLRIGSRFGCRPDKPGGARGRHWRQQHERAIVDDFVALLSIPNIASDRVNIQRNADQIQRMLDKHGIPSRLVSIPGANPVVFGENQNPWSRAHHRFLCPLRRAAARPQGMGHTTVPAHAAQWTT